MVCDVEVTPFSPVYENPYTWVDARSTTNIKNDVPSLEDPHSCEENKCLGFKNEVYSLVVASDMKDWFNEDVSIHCFPDTELQDLSLHQQPHKSISGNETLNTMTTLKLQDPSSF